MSFYLVNGCANLEFCEQCRRCRSPRTSMNVFLEVMASSSFHQDHEPLIGPAGVTGSHPGSCTMTEADHGTTEAKGAGTGPPDHWPPKLWPAL